MGLFRKKPVEVEAWQFNGTLDGAPEWMKGLYAFDHITIPTLEGNMIASPGDWIIRGVTGELYPCKPDIFELTYERVDQ